MHQWYQQGEDLIRDITETKLPENALAIWSLGQIGVVVKHRDTIIYIDPVLSKLTYPGGEIRTNFLPPFSAELADHADYVICTHDHADHLNDSTVFPLLKASKQAKAILAAPLTHRLTDQGVDPSRVLPAYADKAFTLAEGIRVVPVAAAHEEYQTDAQGNHFFLGFLLDFGGVTLYHAGDTLLTNPLIHTLQQHKIDVAILPINGCDLKRSNANILGNMNPREAADLADMINADMVLPMHFNMVPGNTENPAVFADYMYRAYSGRKFHIMALGERFIYMR